MRTNQKCTLDKVPRKLSKEQYEIIIGSLLGDGSLQKSKRKTHNSCLRILRKSSDIKYLCWQFSKLEPFCSTKGVKRSLHFDERTGKTYTRVRFNTRAVPIFTVLREQWYSNTCKKVPNINLTPLIVAVWFCDDGCFYFTKQKQLSCAFSTNSFTRQGVKRLIRLLNDFIGDESFFINKHENGFIIVGGTAASLKLFQIIHDHINNMHMSRKIRAVKQFIAYRTKYNMRTTSIVQKEIDKILILL